MTSIQVLATPIKGRERSSSVKPTAFSMARAGARPGPTRRSRLFNRGAWCMNLFSLLVLFLLALFHFGVNDGSGRGVDVDLCDDSICAKHFHFPDRFPMLLFEFGFHHGARDVLRR